MAIRIPDSYALREGCVYFPRDKMPLVSWIFDQAVSRNTSHSPFNVLIYHARDHCSPRLPYYPLPGWREALDEGKYVEGEDYSVIEGVLFEDEIEQFVHAIRMVRPYDPITRQTRAAEVDYCPTSPSYQPASPTFMPTSPTYGPSSPGPSCKKQKCT